MFFFPLYFLSVVPLAYGNFSKNILNILEIWCPVREQHFIVLRKLRRNTCLRGSGKSSVAQKLTSGMWTSKQCWSLDTEGADLYQMPWLELQVRLHSETIFQFFLQSHNQWVWPHCDISMPSTHSFWWSAAVSGMRAVQVWSQISLTAFCQKLYGITPSHSGSWLKSDLVFME